MTTGTTYCSFTTIKTNYTGVFLGKLSWKFILHFFMLYLENIIIKYMGFLGFL
jgi:hypothetical protein